MHRPPTPALSSPPSSPPIAESPVTASDRVFGGPSLQHPLAASAKSTWRPPLHEKKHVLPTSEPESYQNQPRHSEFESTPYRLPFAYQSSSAVRTPQQIESESWDEASARVVDGGHGLINLDERNLTAIPQTFIDDLAKFYIPPKSSESFISTPGLHITPRSSFGRVATVPQSGAAMKHPFTRTHSAADASFGVPRESLQLFLVSNNISVLPPSLFSLRGLTVLSLRNNLITYIPPEIVHLENLTSLSIGGNRIKFLPSEILQMSLQQLQVIPNPFIEPPERPSESKRHRSSTLSRPSLWSEDQKQRIVSKATHPLPRVLSLVEISLRVLLSSTGTNSGDTVLRTYYNIPLDGQDHTNIPSHLRRTLKTCMVQSISRDDQPTSTPLDNVWWSKITGIDICPSPRHDTKHIFIQHAEERFSWEKTIANVDVGGLVPLRWRGCQWGCLDYLDGTGDAVEGCQGESIKYAFAADEIIPGGGAVVEDAVTVIQFGIGALDEFDG